MQTELDALNLPLEVKIIGINQIGLEAANPMITSGRDIPWLQDVLGQEVWTLWNVTYRDVILVDENNYQVSVFNLTTHNLGTPAEYDDLKQQLIDLATPAP